jgi:MSHA biogenesis protein MshI
VFGLLKRRADAKGRIGLSVERDRIAVAVVNRVADQVFLSRCEILPIDAAGGAEAVAAAVRDAGLPKYPVSAVLGASDYQIALVEAPDVPHAELRAAMRWRLKDAIDFRIEDAVIDVFDLPAQNRGSRAHMVYGVAAKRSAVDHWAASLAATSTFDVVDVPELCLRNLASNTGYAPSGVALLHFGANSATVILVRGRAFYFARQMDLGAARNAGGIVLELQRSLDYYERHFDQPPITRIAISPTGPRAEALADELKRETGFEVTALDLNAVLQCAAPIDAGTQSACLLAVGAALREERRAA